MFLIGLGANLPSRAGGPRQTLQAALAAMQTTGLRILAQSRWYRSAAYPAGSGPDFVNAAAVLAYDGSPEALLSTLHRIEAGLDRERQRRWAPRSCDLDLLAACDAVRPDPVEQVRWMHLAPDAQGREIPSTLILPHPRMHQRAFVLAPLAEIAPGWRHPVLGQTTAEMLAGLPDSARCSAVPMEQPQRRNARQPRR